MKWLLGICTSQRTQVCLGNTATSSLEVFWQVASVPREARRPGTHRLGLPWCWMADQGAAPRSYQKYKKGWKTDSQGSGP